MTLLAFSFTGQSQYANRVFSHGRCFYRVDHSIDFGGSFFNDMWVPTFAGKYFFLIPTLEESRLYRWCVLEKGILGTIFSLCNVPFSTVNPCRIIANADKKLTKIVQPITHRSFGALYLKDGDVSCQCGIWQSAFSHDHAGTRVSRPDLSILDDSPFNSN